MTDRRSYVLVVLAVVAVGLATRAVPLYWSPLPATLDGLRYASLAADATATGHLPFTRLDADEIVFTGLLSVASQVTGRAPLRLAQPLVVVTGATGGVFVVALVRRAGADVGWDWGWNWSARHVRVGAALAGLTLALNGLYVWRTGVPDEEAFGLLLVPLLALAVHRLLRSRRPGWAAVALVFMVAFPPLHNLSAMLAVLTLTALVAVHLVHTPDRPTAVLGLGLVGAFWGYFFGFFQAAAKLGLTITYSGLLREHAGLFLAWVVVLVVGTVWVGGTRPTLQRGTFALAIAIGFLVVGANALTPVFPGTIATPPVVLGLVLGYTLPVGFAAGMAPALSAARSTGGLLLAMFAAPVVMTLYALTGSLTPDFFGAVMRIQTFGHLPVFVLAGLAAGRISSRLHSERGLAARMPGLRPIGTIAIGLLVVSAAVTVPLAYLDLDTVTYPSTVTTAEFQAATFAATHVDGAYATDTNQARIAHNYVDGPGTPVVAPTRAWLADGARPGCPVLSRRGWTTTGAHLFPTRPQTIAPVSYDALLAQRHLVYASTGLDPFVLTRPLAASRAGC